MEPLSAVIGEFGHPNLFGERDFNKCRMFGGASRRTYQPIRRRSYLAGQEGHFWRPVTRQAMRQIVLAAKRYEWETKASGARNGALGTVAIEVLDYLANLVDWSTGRLEPSIETLKTKIKRSRDAIVRGLKALRQHGFIDWLRRYVPTGNEEGVQVQQTSNAYRLLMPKRALEMLGKYGQPTPLPDDFVHARQQHEADWNRYIDELPFAEQPAQLVDDDALSQALSKLGRYIDQERESAKQTESLSRSIIIGSS